MADLNKHTKSLNRQLYPTGRAWYYIHGPDQIDTEITEFVDGLGNAFVDGLGNHFIASYGSEASPGKRLNNALLKSYERFFADIFKLTDSQLADNDNFDEIDASNWERVYGLNSLGKTIDERKAAILRKQGGNLGTPEKGNYLYIQEQLRAVGFDVYITENRFADGSGGWDVVNPDSLAAELWQMGTAEMGVADMGGDLVGIEYTICANHIEEDLDSSFYSYLHSFSEMGVGEMGVDDMELIEQPPTDNQLKSTFFIGGSSFPSIVTVPIARKDEFRQLVLMLKPAQTLAYLYINYI